MPHGDIICWHGGIICCNAILHRLSNAILHRLSNCTAFHAAPPLYLFTMVLIVACHCLFILTDYPCYARQHRRMVVRRLSTLQLDVTCHTMAMPPSLPAIAAAIMPLIVACHRSPIGVPILLLVTRRSWMSMSKRHENCSWSLHVQCNAGAAGRIGCNFGILRRRYRCNSE